jgi:hypothetical protein
MMNPDEMDAAVARLHDSVLLSIEVFWPQGIARLRFRSAAGGVSFSIAQFTFVECPRRLPWGSSECVNEVRVVADPSGSGVKVTVEMQSGDSVLVAGAGIVVERED